MIKYGTALIGLVILSGNASGFGNLFLAGAKGGTQIITGLQGRN
jgi:hypothetical protein